MAASRVCGEVAGVVGAGWAIAPVTSDTKMIKGWIVFTKNPGLRVRTGVRETGANPKSVIPRIELNRDGWRGRIWLWSSNTRAGPLVSSFSFWGWGSAGQYSFQRRVRFD